MISLECKLPDTPGSLIELIKPISENGGNIFGILHHHDKKINNMIPVSISFELPQELIEANLEKIQRELKEKRIIIEKLTMTERKNIIIVILIDHVFDTDVVDTIRRLASKNFKVIELQAKFTEISEVSNVKLKLELPESTTEKDLIKELNIICDEKKLSLIRA